jgi:hypothetical protein
MANPFLFGEPAAPTGQPVNPFLMESAAPVANPFMAAAPQPNPYAAPVEAANPFAAFAAQPVASSWQQPQPQAEEPSQAAHYVMADHGGHTEVTASAQAPPTAAARNPFAALDDEPVEVQQPVVEKQPEPPAPVVEKQPEPPAPVVEKQPEPPAPVVEKQPEPAPVVEKQPDPVVEEEEVKPVPVDEVQEAPIEPAKTPTPPPAEEQKEEKLSSPATPEKKLDLAEQVEKLDLDDDKEEEAAPKEEGFSGIFSPGSEQTAEKTVHDEQPKIEEEEYPEPPPVIAGGTGAALFGSPDSDSDDERPPPPPTVSTGDALFADIPAVPDYKSTGANIFGASEESATNTTGATLFEVSAPREARPPLGAMSGWDAGFDQKFDSAPKADLNTKPGDPFDPFGGPKGVQMTGAAAFGVEDDSDGFGGDDFSRQKAPQATPLIARREENPFAAMVADGENDLEDGPLFDDDTSQPIPPFPRTQDAVEGWEMYIRHPPKKKMTAQRFWKKIYVRLSMQAGTPCVQLFDTKDSKDAFQEVALQAAYSLSDISHQVFDQYSKIFTLKLQFVSYKERAGIRPGQVTKMQKLTGKLSFLAKAVEDADYQGVKEFASDMKKLGIPVEHAPTVSELLKLGSTDFEELKRFSVALEERLFRMDALRDRSITYKTEEIQLTAVDEVFVEQTKTGHVIKQLCRVRVFFLSFLSGT